MAANRSETSNNQQSDHSARSDPAATSHHIQSETHGLDNSTVARNRLLAKALIKNQQQSSSSTNYNQKKRTFNQLETISSREDRSSPNPKRSTHDQLKPLPNRIGKFVDYDLSTIKNTKAGFLLADEEDDPRLLKQRQQIQELKNQRLKQAQKFNQAPIFSLDKSKNPKCKVCGSIELDFQLYQVFKVPVCPKCKNEHPERFSLLTKTECKQDYLLTDPELKDTELLPHLLKANPHQSTYSNMMLFLREQVEEYAFSEKKWGSEEALDEEFERRQKIKKKLKNQKFENQLKDLRKKTRSNLWHKRQEAVHHHTFVLLESCSNSNPPSSTSTNQNHSSHKSPPQIQKCTGCGLEIECETF